MSTARAIVVIAVGGFVLNLGHTTAQDKGPQPAPIGTVDGRPLAPQISRSSAVARFRLRNLRAPSGPADEQQVANLLAQATCDYIKGQIQSAAITAQERRFAISVSTAEGEALWRQYWTLHDAEAEAKTARDNATAYVMALTQVYDNGMDPQEAYQRFVRPQGIPENVWQANLELGRTPEGRAKLGALGSVTADALRKSASGVQAQVGLLEKQRLDDAVDQEIASTDPTFRAYVDELHRNTTKPTPFSSTTKMQPLDQKKYIDTKRAEWWASRYAEVNLVLYDASIATQCGLASMGVKISGR